MSSCIHRFSERVSPLRDLLEKVYAKLGSMKNKSVSKLSLESLGWTGRNAQSFHGLQMKLMKQARTAHRNPDLALCVYTDASDNFWTSAVTQCHPQDLFKHIDK